MFICRRPTSSLINARNAWHSSFPDTHPLNAKVACIYQTFVWISTLTRHALGRQKQMTPLIILFYFLFPCAISNRSIVNQKLHWKRWFGKYSRLSRSISHILPMLQGKVYPLRLWSNSYQLHIRWLGQKIKHRAHGMILNQP